MIHFDNRYIINMVVLCTKMTYYGETAHPVNKKDHERNEQSMKISLKQIIAVLLALVMVLALFAGCTGGTQSSGTESSSKAESSKSSSSKADDSKPADDGDDEAWREVAAKVDIPEILKKDPEHLEWMDDTSPISISVYYHGLVQEGEFAWNTPVEQKITELTGVTVDGIYASDSDGNELTLMIASGDPLPDIIRGLTTSSAHYRDLVDSGSLYRIDELIDQYCPLFWEVMDEFPVAASREADGSLYHLPKQYLTGRGERYAVANGWFAIRGDIAEHYGIEPLSIKTLDDLESFIETVMADRDELWPEILYPISCGANQGEQGGRPWYNSFGGYANYGANLCMLYDKDDDSVHYWIEDDYGYKSLQYSWSLAQKGWITEASFSYPGTYDAMVAGSVLVASGGNMWPANFVTAQLQENIPGAYYAKIPMIGAEEGMDLGYASSMYLHQGACVVVTTDCANPERTIKFLEFLGSEYGGLLVTCGIYGEDWDISTNEDGLIIGDYIGEAATPEGRAARGVYNYNMDWYNLNSNYDYFNAAFGGDKMMLLGATYFKFDLYSDVPSGVMTTEPADSDYSILKKQLEEIIKNYQTDMVLAPSEAEFNRLYEECLKTLNDNGLDRLKDYVLGLTKDKIATMEGFGVEFK